MCLHIWVNFHFSSCIGYSDQNDNKNKKQVYPLYFYLILETDGFKEGRQCHTIMLEQSQSLS